MLLWLLVKLGLKKKPKVLVLLESIAYRADTQNKRISAIVSKALSIIYWYEIIFSKSVFKRMPEDVFEPEVRIDVLSALIDLLGKYGANQDVLDECKIKLMKFAAKQDITINKIDSKYSAKTNLLDDIATEQEASRGRWGG